MATKKTKKEPVKDKTLLVDDFNNSIEKVLEYYLLNEYTNLAKKIFKSKAIFIFLTLSSLIMSTTIVILTMFVIGKEIGGRYIQMFFVCISVLSTVITFITGIDNIFAFKKRKELYSQRIEKLNEIILYIDSTYKSNKNVEKLIINVSEKLHKLEDSQQIN